MWTAEANRQQLLEYFQSGQLQSMAIAETSVQTTFGMPRRTDVRLVWATEPQAAATPSVLVIRREHMHEFLAWANTYLLGWRPLSSLVRVISEERYNKLNVAG